MHRIVVEDQPLEIGLSVVVTGDEAEHAIRVKRLEPGQHVCLLDLAGTQAVGVIDKAERARGRDHPYKLVVRVEVARTVPPLVPEIHICTATPKGGRADDLIDQVSQTGAASWRPLRTERGVVEPRQGKLDRLERIAREAAKQCGRARVLAIGAELDLGEALSPREADAPITVLFADASGDEPPEPPPQRARLLIGPEGGWSERELEVARSRGASVVRFGPHAMRIETAAVVAAGILMRKSMLNGYAR